MSLSGKVKSSGIVKGTVNVPPESIDGKSAYELAVINGFKGTETEWLASLEGASGVYVGSGEMPEDCNVQIDINGETVDINDYATKQYVEREIAEFDFIKIVETLPAEGLQNRIYLVPSADASDNNLFDEYIWAQNAWEYITTKSFSVELADYITEQGIDGIWEYEKWNSGKAVCVCGYTFNGSVTAETSSGRYVSDAISVNFPEGLFKAVPRIFVSPQFGRVNFEIIKRQWSYANKNNSGDFLIRTDSTVTKEEAEEAPFSVSFKARGRWK